MQEHKSATAKFQCQVCKESLPSFYNLHLHLKKVHKATIKLTCNLCGETFQKNRELIIHLEAHQNDPDKSRSHSSKSKPKTKTEKSIFNSKSKPKAKHAKRTRKNTNKTEKQPENAETEKPTSFAKGKRNGGATLKGQAKKSKVDETTEISSSPSVDLDKFNDVSIGEPSTEISIVNPISPPPPSPPPVLPPQSPTGDDDWGWDTDPHLSQPELTTTLKVRPPPDSSLVSVPALASSLKSPPAADLQENSVFEEYLEPLSPKLEVFDDFFDNVDLEDDLITSHSVDSSSFPSNVSESLSSFTFQCSKCDLQFGTNDLLSIHQSFHNLLVLVNFRCEVPSCVQYFDDAVKYQRHFTSSHSKSRNRRSRKSAFNGRRRQATITCKYCSKKSRTKSEAILHEATHSKMLREDPKKSNPEAMQKPQKLCFADEDSELEDPAEDPLMLIESIPESDSDSEIVEMTPDPKLQDDAMEMDSNSGDFDEDVNSVEESATKPNLESTVLELSLDVIHGICKSHVCINCKKMFYSESALEEHMTVQFGDSLISCPKSKCILKFTTECALERHRKSDHLKAEERIVDLSAEEIRRQENDDEQSPQLENTGNLEPPPKIKKLPSPSRTAHGVQRSTDSPNGDQQFAAKCSLERQLKSNRVSLVGKTVVNSFLCPECPTKVFGTDTSLRDHLAKDHKKITCHVCPICKKQFTRREYCRLHILRHKKEKLFPCPVVGCFRAYRSAVELKRHFSERHPSEAQKNRAVFPSRREDATPSRLLCSHCPSEFETKAALEKHQGVTHRMKPYPCPQCDRKYMTRRARGDHVRNTHSAVKRFTCPQCPGRFFCSKYALQTHLPSHSSEQPFVCPTCASAFKREKDMKEHMKRHTDVKAYVCSVANCSMAFTSSSELYYHRRKMHWIQGSKTHPGDRLGPESDGIVAPTPETRKQACDLCEASFLTRLGWARHKLGHPDNADILCYFCGGHFPTAEALEGHKQMRHTNTKNLRKKGERKICHVCGMSLSSTTQIRRHMKRHEQAQLICDECGKPFKTGSELKLHKNTHLAKRPFKCKFCPYRYSTPSAVYQHMHHHHTGPGDTGFVESPLSADLERSFRCDADGCSLSFTSLPGLKQHQLYHAGEKKASCKKCGEKFVTIFDAYVHKAVVHKKEQNQQDQKQYECKHCQKSFINRTTLDNHVRYNHTLEEPFPCTAPDCDRKFKTKSDLKYHTVVAHTGEYKFECEVCGKKFATRGNYNTHMRVHTGIRVFRCEEEEGCEASFKAASLLKKHLYKDHGRTDLAAEVRDCRWRRTQE